MSSGSPAFCARKIAVFLGLCGYSVQSMPTSDFSKDGTRVVILYNPDAEAIANLVANLAQSNFQLQIAYVAANLEHVYIFRKI